MFSVVASNLLSPANAGRASVRPSAPAPPTFSRSARLSRPSVRDNSLLLLCRLFRQQHCVVLAPPNGHLPIRREIAGGNTVAAELGRGDRRADRVAADCDPCL